MTEMLISGEAFEVHVEGNEAAPVLMLAHSLGTDMRIFDWIIPELVKHFRVVRYDARGHGESVVTPGPYSIEELGTDALNIMAALGLEKVNWIGLSMGSMVGLWLLTHAPEKIGKAVLANTAAQLGSAEMWNERIRVVEEEGLDVLAPSILENWFTKGFREHHSERVERVWEMLLRTPAHGYAGACAALRDMDQREDIRSITKPVLVIVGRHDPVATPGLGALVASAIPGAKLVTLATAHMSCVEEPEAFTQASIEFLTAEAPMLTEEDTEHQVTPEIMADAPPPPPKKPRKPRSTKLEVHEAYIDDAPTPEEVAASHMNGAAHAADVDAEDYASAPVVRAPAPRKPRRPKAAKAAVAKAAPAAEPAPARPRRAAAKKAAPRKAAAKKSSARKAPARKAPARKTAASKTAASKSSARKSPARKSPARKSAARKSVARKTTARKGVGKKVAAKKTARGTASVRKVASARKAVAKRTVAKKSAVKKSAVKRSAAKKAPVRKIAAKKAAVRKAVVKKTQAKKAVRKTAAKKTTSRKAMPRRVPGRRPTRKR